MIDWKALKEPAFIAYASANLLIFLAYFIPMFFVPFYAIQRLGTTPQLGFDLLAVLNAASAFGRIGSSLISQKVGADRLLLAAIVTSSVLLFAWIGVHTLAGFVVFCVLFGFFSGILISANPVTMAHPAISPTPGVFGTRLGMQWFATSIGVLIGAPIAGALGDDGSDEAFRKISIFSGVTMAAGASLFMVPLIAIQRHDKMNA